MTISKDIDEATARPIATAAEKPKGSLLSLFVDMETGSGWRLPALDGLRACAALMVLVSHAHQSVGGPSLGFATPWVAMGGQGGVMLFFALSGFLLYLPWARSQAEGKPPPRFKQYAARRCLRIMPAYYACVVILAIAAVLWGKPSLGARDFAAHFLFLPLLSTVQLQGVFWSLQVEEFFYWALPFLHRVFARVGPWRGLLGCAAVSVAYGVLVAAMLPARHLGLALSQTPFYLVAFGCGITSAILWVRQRTAKTARLHVVAGIAAYLAISPLSQIVVDRAPQLTALCNLAVAPSFSLLVLGVARGGLSALGTPWMRFLGSISYSLYLWHATVIRNLPLSKGFGPVLVMSLVGSVAVATLSFLVLERPFLMMRPSAHARARA